ncbi:unnamed protein product [Chrysoparadoxa australica]
MGAGGSAVKAQLSHQGTLTQQQKKQKAQATFNIDVTLEPNAGIINHYMPPTFPLDVVMGDDMMDLVRRTWTLIMDGKADGMKSYPNKAGIVLFYDEFFFRLFKRARIFLDIFPEPAKRGEVLMKALGMMLRIEGTNSEKENTKLFYLGRAHRYKTQLRPWMFSVYATTCLETLVFWLGGDADLETGEAWTCLCGYVLRRMLMAYLPDMVVPNEYYQNFEIHAVRKIVQQSMHSTMPKSTYTAAGGGHNTRTSMQPPGSQRGGSLSPAPSRGGSLKNSAANAARAAVEAAKRQSAEAKDAVAASAAKAARPPAQ